MGRDRPFRVGEPNDRTGSGPAVQGLGPEWPDRVESGPSTGVALGLGLI